jgi:hypothetical protein
MFFIKFDFLCDLNSFGNKLYEKSGLQCFDYCSFHTTDKYDNNCKYMAHRVYICSNLKSHSMVSQSDDLHSS